MDLTIDLDWENDVVDHGRRPRRRGAQQLRAGELEQYMWFNTLVRPEGTRWSRLE
jgi:hypothetical protein